MKKSKPFGWEVPPDEYLGESQTEPYAYRFYRIKEDVFSVLGDSTLWICKMPDFERIRKARRIEK
jgi:hypothetical protein